MLLLLDPDLPEAFLLLDELLLVDGCGSGNVDDPDLVVLCLPVEVFLLLEELLLVDGNVNDV